MSTWSKKYSNDQRDANDGKNTRTHTIHTHKHMQTNTNSHSHMCACAHISSIYIISGDAATLRISTRFFFNVSSTRNTHTHTQTGMHMRTYELYILIPGAPHVRISTRLFFSVRISCTMAWQLHAAHALRHGHTHELYTLIPGAPRVCQPHCAYRRDCSSAWASRAPWPGSPTRSAAASAGHRVGPESAAPRCPFLRNEHSQQKWRYKFVILIFR